MATRNSSARVAYASTSAQARSFIPRSVMTHSLVECDAMRRMLSATVFVIVASCVAGAQTRTGPTLFEGARLITIGTAPIQDPAFLVDGGRITAVGARGTVKAPAGAAVVDLRGKTVMPAIVDAHS